jgi:hypothetical protein
LPFLDVSGKLLRALGRRLLWIPVHLFVDDFFTAERAQCVQQAMETFARLVRACLGESSLSKKKLVAGCPLVVLGVEISVDARGAEFWPSTDKVHKWLAQLDRILARESLTCGEAAKLSGQFQWATQYIFKRLGRVMLRPLIEHRSGWNRRLMLALKWWREVLSNGFRETRRWEENAAEQVHLFTDARSTPPRVAAVLFKCFLLSHPLVLVCVLPCSHFSSTCQGWPGPVRRYGTINESHGDFHHAKG